MFGLGTLPSVENLQCFLAAAEHLNFRRASATVALTPTAFGQRIRQLEDQLGCALFERTTRSVRLTEAGAALVPRARETLAHARLCLESVHNEAPPLTFVIGSRYELARSWIAPALVQLRASRPSWRTHIYCGSGQDIINRLIAGDVDCIITSAPMARSGWTSQVLHPETYRFVGAPSLLAQMPLDGPEDCARHTLLDVDQSLPLTRYLTAAPGPPLTFADHRYLGSGGAMLQLTVAGHGVAVLPDYMIESELSSGALVRLLPERVLLTDSFRMIYKASSPLARAFESMAGELRGFPLR